MFIFPDTAKYGVIDHSSLYAFDRKFNAKLLAHETDTFILNTVIQTYVFFIIILL